MNQVCLSNYSHLAQILQSNLANQWYRQNIKVMPFYRFYHQNIKLFGPFAESYDDRRKQIRYHIFHKNVRNVSKFFFNYLAADGKGWEVQHSWRKLKHTWQSLPTKPNKYLGLSPDPRTLHVKISIFSISIVFVFSLIPLFAPFFRKSLFSIWVESPATFNLRSES